MADNNNLTVYQKLFYLFGQGGGPKMNTVTNKYNLGGDNLIITKSREDFEKEKLQQQQQRYLQDQWAKVDSELYQKAVFYETSRVASYMDFEAMEFTPEIAVALDTMSEESCLVGSTLIPLLNGDSVSIKDLFDENYTNFWVYGVKLDEDEIKPSIVEKVVYKGYKDVYKITLDDETEIKCTPDHKWLGVDNKWVDTINLQIGTPLKSIYRKETKNGYEKISLNDHWSKYKLTHRIVADDVLIEQKNLLKLHPKNKTQKIVVHHKSFNKLNNDPTELEYMFWDDHQNLHNNLNSERWLDHNFSNKMKNIFSENAKNMWAKLTKEERFVKRSYEMKKLLSKLTKEDRSRIYGRKGESNGMYGVSRFGKSNPNYNHHKNHMEDINESEYINFITSLRGDRVKPTTKHFNLTKTSVIKYNKILCKKYELQRIEDLDFIVNKDGYSITKMKEFIKNSNKPHREFGRYCVEHGLDYNTTRRFINKKGYNNWLDLVNNFDNHRVVKIEYVGKEDVYDLVNSIVDSTFAVKCQSGMVISHNCTINEQGKILSIYSESSRVKKVLEDLFFNVLDIHSNLPMWTRNTPIRENSIIPLLDGTEITIKELSEKVKSGEEVWTYSIQDGTKSIVPSKIVWCDLTRKNSELYRVTLDDGTYLDTTPDHEYMLRDGSFKRADELTKGQSLMPFYSRKSEKKKDRIVGYEKVFNPNTGKYKFTHTMVAHGCIRDLEQEKLIGEQFDTHHVDFNKLNNHPNNLVRLTHSEHFKLHVKHLERTLYSPEVIKKRMGGIDKYLRSDKRRKRLSEEMKGIYPKYFKEYNNSDLHTEHNKIRSLKMLSNWGDPQFIEKTKKGMIITINNECLEYISSIIKNSDNYIGINKLSELLKSDFKFIELLKKDYTLKKDITKSINPTTLKKVIYRKTNKNYFDFILDIKPEIILDKNYIKAKSIFEGKTKNSVINHKVVSVVKLDEKSDVYCLEAVGPNGEHDRHNFPVLGKHEDGSYSRTSGVFLSNCKYGDNFVYLKLHNKDGIVGSSQLTNIEIERKEDNQFKFGNQEENKETKGKEVKFIWKDKSMEFNAWEIAHFRLLGDDRKLPYGTSVLEKVRAIWKKLLLAEDAMLVYRVTRAPERRVFKVYVGNIDDADVEAYVQKVANKFKRTQTSDRQTGQVDIRYNTLAVDQDYFVPVRDPNASMPIETLPGASNLDQIADLQYIQRKMVTALRVPKTFLGFEEAVGEGKNLALLDIRFARTINRIQQAMIQELNKIAIIHLYILGFHDELNNFKLTLNNPSTQGEMLKVEQWKEKVLLYKDLVSAVDGGIAPTSHTWAKKNIFNWSADEILEDLEQQRLERAASKELEMTPEVIKNTGFFKKVDKLYGEIPTPKAPEEGDMGGESEGGFGGDEAGGGFGDFGGFGGDEAGGGFGGDEAGGEFGGGETEGGFGEGFRGDENVIDRLLLEGRKRNEDILIMTKGIDELLNEENIDDDELLID